jgi:hypothetical protein
MDTSGRWDVKKWIFPWGSDARVLEPVELWEEIRDELKSSLELYGEVNFFSITIFYLGGCTVRNFANLLHL